jgi:HSP20 family protein
MEGDVMKIRSQVVGSVLDDIERVQHHIADRAQRIFRERGTFGNALQDWLTAERETVWRPAIEVVRTSDTYVIEAAVAGVDPKRLDLRVTADELLLTADVHHSAREQEGDVLLCEFATGPLFRSYRFPAPIDPDGVSAEYRHGLLRIIAPLAQPATKVDIQAA